MTTGRINQVARPSLTSSVGSCPPVHLRGKAEATAGPVVAIERAKLVLLA